MNPLAAWRPHPEAIKLPAEFRLAAACAIWPQSEARSDAVRRAAQDVDWDRFLRVAANHGITGLAHHGLRAAGISVPHDAARILSRQAHEIARRNLTMAAEAARLRACFAEAGIALAFLKGLPLAMLAYGTIAVRPMLDLDLLIPEPRVPAAMALLARAGYRPLAPAFTLDAQQVAAWMRARKHFVYFNDARRVMVELHWRLADNPLLLATPAPAAWVEVPIAKGIVMPTLPIDDLLVYLALHGAQHGWSRLKWLADIAALCAAEPARLERLLAGAERQGLGRVARQMLILLRCLFAVPMPAEFPPHPPDERAVRWLAATALRTMTRGRGEIGPEDAAFTSVGVSLSRFVLKRGWRFKLAQLTSAMTSAGDWDVVALPPRWRGLYPALRLPLWLWRRIVHHRRTLAR